VPVAFFPAATSVYSAAYSITGVHGSVAAASELQLSATALNGGSMLWRKDGPQPVRMAVLWRTAKGTVAGDHRFWLPDDVFPGQSASVACTLTAPAVTGSYILVLGLVHENVAWFGAATPNVELPVTVR